MKGPRELASGGEWLYGRNPVIEALRAGLLMTGGKGLFPQEPGMPSPYMLDTPENLERGLEFLRTADVRDMLDRIPRDIDAGNREVLALFAGGRP